MNNPLKNIPWFKPEFGEEEKNKVLAVLESGYINDGKMTREFEKKIADLIKVKYAVGVSNGTAALALSLMAFGVGPGDEVIVPDFTFIATANAVKLAGANVKLVDIDFQRLTISIEKVKESIGPRTKAIIPVDVNGRGADYKSLEKIAKENNLFLITDSTEALGSKYNGKYLGSFGDAGCFSFSANKTITCGQGGMVVTDNEELYWKIRQLKDQGRKETGTGGDDLHPVLGFNFKLTNLQTAIGLAQLEKLKRRLKKAEERDLWYEETLKDCPEIILPLKKEGEILQWRDILLKDEQDKDKLVEAFKKEYIDYRSFWLPLHKQIPYQQSDKEFAKTIKISSSGLWLPSYFSLSRREVKKTSQVIQQVLKK